MDLHDFTLKIVPPFIQSQFMYNAKQTEILHTLYNNIEIALYERKEGQTIVKIRNMEYNFETMTATYYR